MQSSTSHPLDSPTEVTTILVVDDVALNIELLQHALTKDHPYRVVGMSSGPAALHYLEECDDFPQIMLLDLKMPGMDGFTVLQRLKEIPRCTQLPVIVLTSAEDRSSEKMAFDMGAVDYVKKPFEMDRILVRIRNQLEVQRTRQHLEQLATARAEQLLHADRMATLGTLSAGAAHEINNPTTFISGNVQTLLQFWEILEPLLSAQRNAHPKLPFILAECPRLFSEMREGVDRIQRIVTGLRRFARQEPSDRQPLLLSDVIEDALLLCRSALRPVKVAVKIPDNLAPVLADRNQIGQVLVNLFTNATQAMEESSHAVEPLLELQASGGNRFVHLSIRDNGPGIPNANLSRIWTPFFTTKPAGQGTGLGLPISHGIIEAHGGRLSARNAHEGGALFLLSLPVCTGEEPPL